MLGSLRQAPSDFFSLPSPTLTLSMSVSSPDHNDLQMTDATASTNATASAPTGARAIFEAHRANENWSIYAAKNFFAMYHPEGCTTCTDYAAHAVSALRKGELVSSQNPVAKALDDAFPWYGTGVENLNEFHDTTIL